MKLDTNRPMTVVGGRNPLAYMQDGYGFDMKGNCLGLYDAQGNRLGDLAPELVEHPPNEDETPEEVGDEAPEVAADEAGAEEEPQPTDAATESQAIAESDDETQLRTALEAEAAALGVKFRANISDEKLAERIAEAKETAE